jgi:hypothetical protein
MPIVSVIEPGLVHIKLTGKYTFEESLEAIERATEDEAFENGMCLLLDITASRETRTSYEMEELAGKIGSLRLVIGKRVALYVRQAHHYGLARMHSTFGKRFGMEYAVFVKLDEAKDWLRQKQ